VVVLYLVGLSLAPALSPAAEIEGPVVVGNGIPNGIGGALGRIFLRLEDAEHETAPALPLEVLLTSSVVTVDPVTCSAPSLEPCGSPGTGEAGVSGYPTDIVGPVMHVKLAGASYLPPGSRLGERSRELRGTSFEMALEGTLYAGTDSGPSSTGDLHLFGGDPGALLEWGTGRVPVVEPLPYENNTGTAILLGDSEYFLLPGWLRGRVLQNDGDVLVVEFHEADVHEALSSQQHGRVRLVPDRDAARSAGLTDGSFGILEVNYSGSATPSHVFPEASSNDTELHLTTEEVGPLFLRGDCDGDSRLVLTDAIFLLNYNFLGGVEPPCLAACDSDGGGQVVGEVQDAVYVINHLFLGGPPPPDPYPFCGPEPESPSLSCDTEPDCF
jgi:hypothetical protein